ncbi:MAG: peptidylprolyl isomerase [Anaerolineaceae bacterium]|nr:peptidylprolyl isomerase [Anaerolineaceae bacterium]
MARSPSNKIVSKKHKARLQQEQQQRKMLIIASIIIVAIVLIVLAYGILDQTILKSQKPVAKVGNAVIRSDEFIKMVKLERQQMNGQAYQYESYKQFFGFDEQNSAYFDSLIQQIQSQMAVPETVGATVLTSMIDSKVIGFYAEENGIDVTEQEIQEAIQRDFGYFPNGTPTPENTSIPYATSTLNPTQYALVTATPTLAPTEEVAATEEASPTQVDTVETEPTAEVVEDETIATATVVPSPTAYTEDLYLENYKSFVENFGKIGLNEKNIIELYRVQLINQKVYELITADVPTEEEQLWARHILVATVEEAQEVLARLDNGEDWSVIAAEVSTDSSNKDQGGDLGWFGKNAMIPEFETAAYELEIGEISDPVETSFGFHIIQLLGKEVRPIETSKLDQNKQTVFNEWLTKEKEKYTIEQYDDVWTKIVPNTPAFGDYQ